MEEQILRQELDEALALGALGRMMFGISLNQKFRRYWSYKLYKDLFEDDFFQPPVPDDNIK